MTDIEKLSFSKKTSLLGGKYDIDEDAPEPKKIDKLPKFDKSRLRSLTPLAKATPAEKYNNSTIKSIRSSSAAEALGQSRSDSEQMSQDNLRGKRPKPVKVRRHSPVITRRQSIIN